MKRARCSPTHERHYPLGPALGQCCGGAVTLRFAALDATELERWPVDPPRFHLQLYGAGHVGRAIVRALAPLDVQVDWIDERESEFPADFFEHAPQLPWPDHIRKVCVDTVEAEVRLAPPGAFYLVLTHQHDLDLRISEAILKRGDFGFFGLIGSKTKRARFIHRFEQRGIAAEAIARMTCPIGLPGIDGKEPEVIAAGVVAQLLAQRPAEVELDLEETLRRVNAARKKDPKFKRAIAEFGAAEARHAKSDPVEGTAVVRELGPAQSLVRNMLRRS
jgi:xanthine dehydrogenase accessory factor